MKAIMRFGIKGLVLLISTFSAFGQGFINLDFEQAIVVPTVPTYGWLDWSLAAPGWDHSAGGDTSIVYWGSEHLGMSQYYLLMDSTSPVYAPNTQLAGDYSLAFASGVQSGADPRSPWVNAFISQTAMIPSDARSLQMLATGPFQVFVSGVGILMYSLGGNRYGGDISGFGGTVTEVKIMNTATTIHTPTVVDDIVFSTSAVPEPSSLTLFLVGAVLVLYRKGIIESDKALKRLRR